MSTDKHLSRAFEALQRYYDAARLLVHMREHGVLSSGELQAIRRPPDVGDKLEMLKTALSEDPSRTGAFVAAMVTFCEEGKGEFQRLLDEEESPARDVSASLGDLMEDLPSTMVNVSLCT